MNSDANGTEPHVVAPPIDIDIERRLSSPQCRLWTPQVRDAELLIAVAEKVRARSPRDFVSRAKSDSSGLMHLAALAQRVATTSAADSGTPPVRSHSRGLNASAFSRHGEPGPHLERSRQAAYLGRTILRYVPGEGLVMAVDQSVDERWQRARLFPITGIGNPNEQERRGTSVLLAVLSAVKEFGRALTTRCGSPAGRIETFIEVPFELNGSHCRPDGLIRVTRGQKVWTPDSCEPAGPRTTAQNRRIGIRERVADWRQVHVAHMRHEVTLTGYVCGTG
jgi:hypothetical protein